MDGKRTVQNHHPSSKQCNEKQSNKKEINTQPPRPAAPPPPPHPLEFPPVRVITMARPLDDPGALPYRCRVDLYGYVEGNGQGAAAGKKKSLVQEASRARVGIMFNFLFVYLFMYFVGRILWIALPFFGFFSEFIYTCFFRTMK